MFKQILVCFLLDIVIVYGANKPEVVLENGRLVGKYMQTKNGKYIEAFTSIPFAKPPVGELRFKPPVPNEPWKGPKDASQPSPLCPQKNHLSTSGKFEGQEDCLYLNVYIPENNRKAPLPVLFYVHGGAWYFGSGSELFYAPDLLLDQEAILVTINYRLGAIGFLSTEDDVLPGNLGLKDQHLALEWTKENIANFGGDPNKITIFGHSAGSASVHLLMLSPMSKDLINGAIAQSGTAVASWAIEKPGEALNKVKKLCKALNCPTESNQKMVHCLEKTDIEKIVNETKLFVEWDLDPTILYKPVIEHKHAGAFIFEEPEDIMKKGEGAKVPLIIGFTTGDGAIRSSGILSNSDLLNELNTDIDRILPITGSYKNFAKNVKQVTRKLKTFYFKDKPITTTEEGIKDLTKFYTDSLFLNDIDKTVRLHRKYTKSPVYYYLYGHRGSYSHTEFIGDKNTNYGVCHADDLLSLFPINPRPETEEDKTVSNLLTTLWFNFAKYGKPTVEVKDIIQNMWDPVESDKMEYYFISKESEMRKGLYSDRVEFWRNIERENIKTEL